MELNRELWKLSDKKEYYEYLNSLSKNEKIEWTRKIVNTDMDVLAIPVPKLRLIAKDIMKGNYISFLDLKFLDNYESTMIYGIIINKLKDIKLIKKYLDIYVNYIDNWSSCDVLSIETNDNDKLFDLALGYIKSNKPFIRRVGFRIFFKYLEDEVYLNKIFNVIDSFYDEEHYYVNMIIAWLLCEAFIKNRKLTLKYIENNTLNDFVVNKTISKCRDSYRVSIDDKEMLLKFKRKICQSI
jgi:3-methyladenine DNA glycosylase AlkD